jgi:hypothetical protein
MLERRGCSSGQTAKAAAQKIRDSSSNVNPFPIEENFSYSIREPSIKPRGDLKVSSRQNQLKGRTDRISPLEIVSLADEKSIVAKSPDTAPCKANFWLTL